MTLQELNALPGEHAETELLRCCGSREWAKRMARKRPFESMDAMYDAAERAWRDLHPADWLEAFGAHPRIGESASGNTWAAQEQAGAGSESGLARANERYLAKFGYIFIVCATGKSAEEMLGILNARLPNNPADELRLAAAEQSQITRIRLDKLVTA